jgi:hypothetical protein
MTSHVHLILGTEGSSKLEDIIRDLKVILPDVSENTWRATLMSAEKNGSSG